MDITLQFLIFGFNGSMCRPVLCHLPYVLHRHLVSWQMDN